MIQLARRIKQVAPSPTLTIDAKAKQMKSSGIDVVNFGAGEPDFDTPDYIKEAGIQAIRSGTRSTPRPRARPSSRSGVREAAPGERAGLYAQGSHHQLRRQAFHLQHLSGPDQPRGRGPHSGAVLGDLSGGGQLAGASR